MAKKQHNDQRAPKTEERVSSTAPMPGFSRDFRASLLPALGLTFLLAWLFALLLDFSSHLDSSGRVDITREVAGIVFSAALALTYLLAARYHRIIEPFLARATVREVCPIALCATTIGAMLLPEALSEGATTIVLWGCSLIAGTVSAALFLMYGEWFSRLSMRAALIASVLSFTASSILTVTVLSVPEVVSPLIMALVPLLSGFVVLRSGNVDFLASTPPEHEDSSSRSILLASLYALIVIWGFVNRFLAYAYALAASSHSLAPGMEEFRNLGAIVLALAAALLAVVLLVFPRLTNASLPKRFALASALGTCLVIPGAISLETPVGPIGFTVGPTAFFIMTIWVVGYLLRRLFPGRGPVFFPLLLAAWTFGGLVSDIAFALTDMGQLIEAFDAFAIVSLVVLCLVFMSCLAIFNVRSLSNATFEQAGLAPDTINLEAACQQLASRYDLSSREAEVLLALAQGRNASHIEKTLYISYNTVTTHRKHIYRKLGVHSQQELIDLARNTSLENAHL